MRRKLDRLLPALVLCVLALASFPSSLRAQGDPIRAAYEAYEDGDYDKAWQLFGRLALQHPQADSIQLYYAASIIASGREGTQKLGSVLQRYEQLGGDDALYRLCKARLMMARGEYDRADEALADFLGSALDTVPPLHAEAAHLRRVLQDARIAFAEPRPRLEIKEHRVLRLQGIATSLDYQLSYGQYRPVPATLRSEKDIRLRYDPPAFYHPATGLLFFSSYADGTQPDLYQSLDAGGGKWKKPVRLDQVLNSPWPEYAAWLDPGGKSIWFSSMRDGSLGGYDIFSSTFDSLSLQWSEPRNMGIAFNTRADEFLLYPAMEDGLFVILSNEGRDQGLAEQRLFRVVETLAEEIGTEAVDTVGMAVEPQQPVDSSSMARLPYYRIQLAVTLLGNKAEAPAGLAGTYLLHDSVNALTFRMFGHYRFYAEARGAADSLKEMGYVSAPLIVSYIDRDRITLREALEMESAWNSAAYREDPQPYIPVSEPLTDTVQASLMDSVGMYADSVLMLAMQNDTFPLALEADTLIQEEGPTGPLPVPAEPIDTLSVLPGVQVTNGGQVLPAGDLGIRYSVQIGVFRNYKRPRDLGDPPDLHTDTLPSGLFRYRVGEYATYAEVDSAARRLMKDRLAADTILIAFYQGVELPARAARKIEMAALPRNSGSGDAGVFFSVVIGEDGPDTDISLARLRSEVPGLQDMLIEGPGGESLRVCGNYRDYNEARNFLMIEVSPIVPDARVTGVEQGRAITVMKALELIGN